MVPLGVSKPVKKLQKKVIPKLEKYDDISQFLLKLVSSCHYHAVVSCHCHAVVSCHCHTVISCYATLDFYLLILFTSAYLVLLNLIQHSFLGEMEFYH